MKAEHINPFLSGTQSIFQEVAGLSLSIGGTTLKKSPIATKNVVIMVGITGNLRGNIAINLDCQLAKTIASNMMGGMPVQELDEISKSAVSELGNMLMGRVSTLFSNQNITIDITPPSLLIGENIQLTFAQVPLLSIKFNHDISDIDFDISVSEV